MYLEERIEQLEHRIRELECGHIARCHPDMDTNENSLLDAILALVACRSGLTERVLLGPCKQHNIAAARQTAMYLARERGLTLHEIADYFNRDHGTVSNAVRVTEDRIATDPKWRKRIGQWRQELSTIFNGAGGMAPGEIPGPRHLVVPATPPAPVYYQPMRMPDAIRHGTADPLPPMPIVTSLAVK